MTEKEIQEIADLWSIYLTHIKGHCTVVEKTDVITMLYLYQSIKQN